MCTGLLCLAQSMRAEADKKIPELDISKYSLTDLYIMRNSIYANYGYTFKKNWLNEYFNIQDWYQPNEEFTFDLLTSVDYQNSNKIKKYEKQKRKALLSVKEDDFTTRYFSDLEITNPLPQPFKSRIEEYSKNFDAGYPTSPPSFLNAQLTGEMSKDEFIKFNESDETKFYADPFIVVYDKEGRIRRLERNYFNESGKLVSVATYIDQTSIEIYYYFFWLDKELVQISIYEYCCGDYENAVSKEDIND